VDTKPAPYHELLRVMTAVDPQDPALVACPICKLVRKGLVAYLDDLIYSCGVDPEVRRELRLARGLCNRHAHLFADVVGLALGTTLINWDVIDTVNEELAKHGDSEAALGRVLGRLRPAGLRRRREQLLAALRPSRACMACEHQLNIEKIYINALLEHLDDAELQQALRRSPGLCLPHYVQAVEWAPDSRRLALITEIEHASLASLSAELQELARKYDHRYQNETIGAEGDSWKRSINQIVGLRGIR
jgi:hypothetical protein